MAGRLVYVMGPSGAGKDAVLGYARRLVAGSDILFAHRYITREPTPGDEAFIPLTTAEFAARKMLGLFAYSWRAHGLEYGIGREIEAWLERSAVVVVSGSRAHFHDAGIDHCDSVLITAEPAVIARRLADRGREDEVAIGERLVRGQALSSKATHVIDNSGPLAQAGNALVAILTACADAVAQ